MKTKTNVKRNVSEAVLKVEEAENLSRRIYYGLEGIGMVINERV